MKIHVVPIFLGDGLRPPATTTMVRLTFGLKNLDGVAVSGRDIDEDASIDRGHVVESETPGELLSRGIAFAKLASRDGRRSTQETRRAAETDRR